MADDVESLEEIEDRERAYQAARLAMKMEIVKNGGRGSDDELDRRLALHFFTMGARWQFERQDNNPFEVFREHEGAALPAAEAAWATKYRQTLEKKSQ